MSHIDPSKVKAGDTVTLERCGVTVTGTVESIGVREGETPEFWLADSRAYDTDGYEPWTLTAHQPAPVPEWEPGTVYEITTHDGDTMRAWCHSALDPDAWTAEECVTFVDRDGSEFLPGELKAATPRASVAEALRADLDVARTQVSDLTVRNAALEALVREQKQGIQARDTWIEEQTADA